MGLMHGLFTICSYRITGKSLEEHGYEPKPKKVKVGPSLSEILFLHWLFKK